MCKICTRNRKRSKYLRNQRGEGLLEYAIILALVGLVAVLALSTFGETIRDVYEGFQPSAKNVSQQSISENPASGMP